MNFEHLIKESLVRDRIAQPTYEMLYQLYRSYVEATQEVLNSQEIINETFTCFLTLLEADYRCPFSFEPFHRKVLAPFNHRKFGIEFLKPIVKSSTVLHPEIITDATKRIFRGENVIFLANHQTEVDPHLISLALSNAGFPHFTDDMIFVAGDRVIRDPLARPMSMGYDLLCIYSKRYIEYPKEKKEEKLRHNHKALQILKKLLQQGSQCIYVAPSGGRDRRDEQEIIKPASFNSDSIEVFRILSKSSKQPTSFVPLALKTFDVLPPPPTIKQPLGETRNIFRRDVYLAFGNPVNMEEIPGEKKEFQKNLRKDRLFEEVLKLYEEINSKLA